jgi:hypothetical protein
MEIESREQMKVGYFVALLACLGTQAGCPSQAAASSTSRMGYVLLSRCCVVMAGSTAALSVPARLVALQAPSTASS